MGNYIDKSDIDNWPAGADKDEIIARIELQLEEMTGAHFYAKAFDKEINGNGKNRLYLPFAVDIITVTAIYICGIELDTAWYTFDTDSIFLNLCGSGALGVGDPELRYRLAQTEPMGLFPRGFNNIRVLGTNGNTTKIALAKQACKSMIRAENDPDAYPKKYKSEKIGDYSYDFGDASIYTGIREADELIELLMADKAIMTVP